MTARRTPAAPIDAVDRERVVRDDRLERVGDEVEDAGRIERREQPLVDVEQAPLAVQLVLQLDLLAMQPIHVLGVDERLHGRCGEDRQRHLVVELEAVAADGRHDDQALDDVLLEHRHDQDRFGLVGGPDDPAARIPRGVAEPDRATVLGDPAGEALADRDAQALERRVRGPEERALERERLAHPGLVIDAVDADRVVVRVSRLASATIAHAMASWSSQLAEPAGELGDRGQAIGEGPARLGQAGAADGGGHLVAEGAGQRALVGRPGVGLAVVEHEQAERLVAEDERHEAHASGRRWSDRPPEARGSWCASRGRARGRGGGGSRPSRSSGRPVAGR